MTRPNTPCKVCSHVAELDLIQLDLLMGDASRWPADTWGRFRPPAGPLPSSYRRFGAVEVGIKYLVERGYLEIPRSSVRRHFRFDVPTIVTPDELAGVGQAADVPGNRAVGPPGLVEPLAYIKFYQRGISLGNRGLELMEKRIEALVEKGTEVPLALLLEVIKLGAKLATSQAAIRKSAGEDEDDEDEGFRAGSAPLPSPRFGHSRIRTVDGVARPVRDEGPADRADYNRRAEQEGSTTLPTR